MTSATTRCPKCDTTFRVSDGQLQVAKGKVRCGSCLNVFKAAEHWVGEPLAGSAAIKPVARPAVAAKPKPVSKAQAAGKFQFDQSSIDGGSADGMLTKPAIAAVNTMGEMRAVAAQRVVDSEDDFLISDEEEGLINDGADTQEQQAAEDSGLIESGDDYSDLFLNIGDLSDDEFGVADDKSFGGSSDGGDIGGGGTADESWAKDMLDDLADDSEEVAAQAQAVLGGEEEMSAFADDGYMKKREGARSAFVSGNQAGADEALQDLGLDNPPPRASLNRTPLNQTEMLSQIEPAPVEMEWKSGSVDWAGLVIWGGLSLFAAIGLLGQYGWMQFDTLARESSYRPIYGKTCEIFGCSLPNRFNPEAIRTRNLIVRSDPILSYALAVDVILQNTASYTQPFPELNLTFSDLNNFPVASRLFKPSEYLAGELAGKKNMPPAKSIHISLQIVDPGEEAVNYRLDVSSKKPVSY